MACIHMIRHTIIPYTIEHTYTYIHTNTHIHTYTYMYTLA